MQKVLHILLIFLLLNAHYGCASRYNISAWNRMSLLSLELGMPRSKVQEIMGNETMTSSNYRPGFESFSEEENVFAFLKMTNAYTTIPNPYCIDEVAGARKYYIIEYYVTGYAKEKTEVDEEDLTPVVFCNNKLIGWGWKYLAELKMSETKWNVIEG